MTERQKAKSDVIKACFDNDYHRALVDLRESDIQMSHTNTVKFAASFKDTILPKNYRLACVIKENTASEELIEIIITLDGINIKYFLSFEEAENWLTSI